MIAGLVLVTSVSAAKAMNASPLEELCAMSQKLCDRLVDRILDRIFGVKNKSVKQQVLGAAQQQVQASKYTNLRVEGSLQTCESNSSSRCLIQQTEIKNLPFSTTTVTFQNPRSATTSFSLFAIPLQRTFASSSYIFSCFVTTSQYVAFNASRNVMLPPFGLNTSSILIDEMIIPTSSLGLFNSENLHYVSGTIFADINLQARNPLPLFQTSSSTYPNGQVPVGPSQYVMCLLQHNGQTRVCANDGLRTSGDQVACYAPTSTQRNLNLDLVGNWVYTASSTDEF